MENKITQTGTATMTIEGKSYDLPIMKGSMGAPGVDVRSLYKQSGHFTFDPGYTSTCSTESQITYIDGGIGQLLYRGYDIEQLAEHSTSLEVAYLLIHGELPNAKESRSSRKLLPRLSPRQPSNGDANRDSWRTLWFLP